MSMSTPIETERKYLIKLPTEQQLKENNCNKTGISQTYLKRNDPKVERRVRKKTASGVTAYYYTEKRKISNMSRGEVERKISQNEYEALLLEGEKSLVKDRYTFYYVEQYFELDIYPDWENEAILEIELASEQQEVVFPDWITVIKEVTGDDRYKNANLAK